MTSHPLNSDTFTGPSFSFQDRVRRLFWGIVQQGLFRFIPRPLHELRSAILRMFGARIGRKVHVYPGVRIWAPWNLEIGDESGVGDGAVLYSQGKITIGRRAVISQGTHLCGGTHDYERAGSPLVTKPITVGSYVWIAAEAFVHPGVTIHEGAVVGARSVVTRDVPAWMVCAGHPCQALKPRQWRPTEI